MQAEPVFFARWPGQRDRAGKLAPRLIGVEAQEIDRFAQLEHCVHQRLARLALAQAEEFVGMFLEQIGRRFEQHRAFLAAQPIPARLDCFGARDRFLDFEIECVAARADFGRQVVRLVDRGDFGIGTRHEGRLCSPVPVLECGEAFLQRFEHQRIGQVDPGRILAAREDVFRQWNGWIAIGIELRHVGHRIGRQIGSGHFGIRHAVDERTVRAVFEQPPDQIGQQVLVRAGGGIDPHIGAVVAFHLRERAVDVLAHAMKALEFEWLAARQRLDRTDGVGVMRGKGGIDGIVCGQHLLRAGEIAHVGGQLAGEDGEILEPANMAELDLGIPIGALDQPDEELAVVFAGQPRGPFDHRHAAFLIGLDGQPEPFPAAAVGPCEQAVIACERLDQIHRQLEPVGFFGIDGEMDIRIARSGREIAHDRQQVGDRQIGMQESVFRMQRGQLHRDARGGPHVAGRFAHQAFDRFVVIHPVAFGIGEAHRGFAKHVEAVRQPARAFGGRALERFIDRAAIDELSAEDAHGLQRRGADHGFAQSVDRALERLAHALLRFLGTFEHFARQHQ